MDSLKPFSHLKEISDTCELLWIGGLHFNERDPTNPLLECVFECLEKGRKQSYDQFSVMIAVGYLPYILCGQLYRKGKKIRDSRGGATYEKRTFTFDTADIQECLLSDTLLYSILNFDFSDLRENSPIKVIPNSDRSYIPSFVVTEVELLRFYFAKSDKLAKHIFAGHFSADMIPRFITNEIHEAPRYIGNSFRFMYRHGFTHSDALVLGRILASETARNSVRRVHDSLVQHFINASTHRLGHFRTDFPFTGPTTLKVLGQRNEINGVFLVKRILSCSGPYPFESLSHCDELQAGLRNPDGEKMRLPGKGSRNNSEKDRQKGASTSTDGPDSAIKPITLKIMTSEHTSAHEIKIESEKLAESIYQFDKQAEQVYPSNDPTDVSTGTGTGRKTGKGKQNIIDLPLPPASGELVQIIKAIQSLRSYDGFIKSISSLKLSTGEYDCQLGEYVVPFPRIDCVHKKRARIFSFINDVRAPKWEKRIAICFEIELHTAGGNKTAYILTAENRKVETAEKLPIILLYHFHRRNLTDVELDTFFTATVKSNGWPRVTTESELTFITLRRSEVNSLTEELLRTLQLL